MVEPYYQQSYDYKSLNISLSDGPIFWLWEKKLFEENGNITGIKITRVHPVEGVTILILIGLMY